MNEDLDRLLAYRNFLAAEDHLDELLYSPSTSEEKAFLQGIKNEIVYMRDDVMPAEVNKEYHCLVKHLATAYEACREVAKATQSDLDVYRAEGAQKILLRCLERLWGRKVITCERCGKEDSESRGIQEESLGDIASTFNSGLTRDTIQGGSLHREPLILGREAFSDGGEKPF